MYDRDVEFSDLIGKILIDVIQKEDKEIKFICATGEQYRICHHQDCCEMVHIEEIHGDLNDLIGSPILEAEISSSSIGDIENNDLAKAASILLGSDDSSDPEEWTFYKLGTIKGRVTIRWYGTSNGYYSTKVDFERCK